MDLYRVAIDEYRFQVNLNWNRTQYYLALNIGILGIATGIAKLAGGGSRLLPGALYFVGTLCCLLSLASTHVQQGYYREARDHKARLEAELRLGTLSLSTTPGMGSSVRRLGKVTTFNEVLLSVLAVIDLMGIFTIIPRH